MHPKIIKMKNKKIFKIINQFLKRKFQNFQIIIKI